MLIRLDSSQRTPLTEQIVKGVARLIQDRVLRPGARLPSIRHFAATHNVSKFTVVNAYDQLVVAGCVRSRPGAGFYVSRPCRLEETAETEPQADGARDVLWLMRRQTNQKCFRHRPGSGWLPQSWHEENGLDRAMRELARRKVDGLDSGYGDPLGYAPLRTHVCRLLAEHGIEACPKQILLTGGVAGGVDLVARHLVRPDDAVLVDDPGFYQWFGHMRALGAVVHGVPWTGEGPDLERLEELAKAHRPRLFITTPVVQNPTGASISPGNAFKLLKLAERYDFRIVEDAIFALCHPDAPPRLAGLDQLDRVIFVTSFSKILSPRLRVGMLAGHKDLVGDLADLKLLTQSASSEYAERLVCEVIDQGSYRKLRGRLVARVQKARVAAIQRLEAFGLGPADDGTHGLFAWLDVPGHADTTPLAEAAIERSMLLAPGALFQPDMEPSPKMRFNVAYCQDDSMFRELDLLLNATARGGSRQWAGAGRPRREARHPVPAAAGHHP